MQSRLPLLSLLLLILLLVPSFLWADSQQDNRALLEQIRSRMEKTSQHIRDKRQREFSLVRELGLLNTSIQQIDHRLKRLQAQLALLAGQIATAERQLAMSNSLLIQQKVRLRQRFTALYKEGDAGFLRILFSADSPMILSEQYTYLTRILQHDKQLIADFRQLSQQHRTKLAQLEQLRQQQQKQLSARREERKDAAVAKRLQAKLLRKVKADRRGLQQELSRLKERAQRLQQLIARLQQPKSTRFRGKLATAKGKLPWPVAGPLLVGFGTQKNARLGTLYQSHGIELQTGSQQQVRAVAEGKVVFSSWFKGYGNLLIVAHAGGYHTLYAQLGKMLKQAGDTLVAGEPLALTAQGDGGSIYFEIRHNGAPLNPLVWLEKR